MRSKKVIITLTAILSLVVIVIWLYSLAIDSMFGGSGPSPRLVLVVPSDVYEVSSLLHAIDKIDDTLGPILNKKDDSEGNRFLYYKHTYWFSQNGSDTYGIALIEWDTTTWTTDEQKMGGSYFIDVYSEQKDCFLCEQLKLTLSQEQIKFRSPCESRSNLTGYERIRCDT